MDTLNTLHAFEQMSTHSLSQHFSDLLKHNSHVGMESTFGRAHDKVLHGKGIIVLSIIHTKQDIIFASFFTWSVIFH